MCQNRYDTANELSLDQIADMEGNEEFEQEWGWISTTELVTDGHMTWFETQRYLYYSPEEARCLFLEHVKDKNWTIKEEA